MTGAQTLIARAALGTTFAGISLVLASSRRLFKLPTQRFDRLFIASFAASRLALYTILFLVLRVPPRGDIPAFYITQAEAVLRHRVPYLDFHSSYAPLHPYFDSLFAALWHSPLAIILAAIVIEIATVPLWLRLARSVAAEQSVRLAMLLYLASPVSLQFVAVDGQDNVVIATLLACAAYLILKHREFLSGVLTGLSLALIKFLPLIFVPVFFLCAPRRWRWLAGAALLPTLIYGTFVLIHAPILQPLTEEGAMRSCGDLSYILEAASGVVLPARAIDLVVLGALSGILLLIAFASRYVGSGPAQSALLLNGIVALSLALMLFSKKSWPPYLMLCFVPLCLLVAQNASVAPLRRLLPFTLFELVAVTEHSIWATNFSQIDSLGLHALLVAHHPGALCFLFVECLVIAGYAWLLIEAIAAIRKATRTETMFTRVRPATSL